MSKPPSIQWPKRAKRDVTDTARRRTWRCECCGRYLVQESVSLFGLSTRYFAIHLADGRQVILGRNCRKLHTAKRLCERRLRNLNLNLKPKAAS